MKRKRLTKRGSRKLFRKTASKVRPVNLKPDSMRGGIRM